MALTPEELALFTPEQLAVINKMIDAALNELDWQSDIEDAVQNAAADARSDTRGCESSIEDLERRVSNLED